MWEVVAWKPQRCCLPSFNGSELVDVCDLGALASWLLAGEKPEASYDEHVKSSCKSTSSPFTKRSL